MKTVCEAGKCTGCMACVDICPKNAIGIQAGVRHYEACIDQALCVECGLCRTVCQNNRPLSLTAPISWQQGWAKDPQVRSHSSSGGAAYALSAAFVEAGGMVCSCSFFDGKFGFRLTDQIEELKAFSGSKYVKSNPEGAYRQVYAALQQGRKVLFIGLPCQVAAMRQYTHDHQLLYTADLICHGSPSPEILELCLKEKNRSLKNTKSIAFRKNTQFQLYQNGKPIEPAGVRDRYMIAFLNGLCYTENCYACTYAQLSRVADITLGDSWGSDLPEQEQEQGVSLLLVQTEKGKELLEQAEMQLLPVDLTSAVSSNHQLNNPTARPPQRKAFLEGLDRGENIHRLIRKAYPKQCFRQAVKSLLAGIIKK